MRVSLIVVVSALALSATAAGRESSVQSVHRATSSALHAPALVVYRRSSHDAPGYIFLAPKGGSGQQGPEIVDDRGRPVWCDPTNGG